MIEHHPANSQSSVHEFVHYLHQQPGIIEEQTNYRLINAICARAICSGLGGVLRFSCPRCSGVTRTVCEFVRWANKDSILVVTGGDRDRYPSTRFGHITSWHGSIRGLHPRPMMAIIDGLPNVEIQRSVVMSQRFSQWLNRFPYPALFIDQRDAA